MFRTALITLTSLLGLITYVTAWNMPRSPENLRVFRVLTGMGFFTALFFVLVYLLDDAYIWWMVPAGAFALTLRPSYRGYDAITRFNLASKLAELGHTDVDPEYVPLYTDLRQFTFTGAGNITYLSHLTEPGQEVGCMVTTPYRGMTLQELVDIAATHECQFAPVAKVAA